MKSKFFYTALLLCMTVMTGMTILSCNKNDEDEEKTSTKPRLLGTYREPYVHEEPQYIHGEHTGHYSTIRYFGAMSFIENENTVEIKTIYSKESMEELKYMVEYKDVKWYQLVNDKGKLIDWYAKGEPSYYTYVIDYEQNIAMFSNGETYELTVDSEYPELMFESLTSTKGGRMYIHGKRYTDDEGRVGIGLSFDDDEYNNKTHLQWLSEYANKNK